MKPINLDHGFYDIKSTKYFREPLNTLSSFSYFISSYHIYEKNPYLALSTALLGIGSVLLHSNPNNKVGKYLDNQMINVILLLIIYQYVGFEKTLLLFIITIALNSMRIGYILLTSILIMILVINSLQDIKVPKIIIGIIVTILILLSLKITIENKNYKYKYQKPFFYFILFGTMIHLLYPSKYKLCFAKIQGIPCVDSYKKISFNKSIIGIILYLIAATFQIYSRDKISKYTFSKYYHSLWHIITSILIIYMSEIL